MPRPLLYDVKNEGKGWVAVVGKSFAVIVYYAIAVREGSPLRKQINLAPGDPRRDQ